MISLLSILIFIQFLPIIFYIGGALVSIWFLSSIWKGRKKIYMSVLGMEGAGKTTWYDYLRGENRASEGATSGGVEISEFTITYKENKATRKLTIAKGLDIDGTRDSIMEYYKAQIEKSDVVFFFFDINKYLEIEEYQRDVHSRLDLVYDFTEEEKRKDVYLIASHMGKVENEKRAFKQARNILSEKKYRCFVKNFAGIEMKNMEAMESLKKKLIDRK